MCGRCSNSFTEARSWPTLLPRRQPSLLTYRLICLTTHRSKFKFNLTYVWSKCELFVWNRCRGMGKALLLWCMQEIGGDCLWPASRIHKGNERAMMKAEDWDCIIGAQSKSQRGESPRCVRYSLNVVRLFIISGRERNKPTVRLTDKFSLSCSQSTELSITINYAIVRMWLWFKWNRMLAKSVLISKYSFLISVSHYHLPFSSSTCFSCTAVFIYFLFCHKRFMFVYQSASSVDWTSWNLLPLSYSTLKDRNIFCNF